MIITVHDAQLQRLLRQISARGSNLAPVMRPISHDLLDGIEESFARERDPNNGRPWKRLAESTIDERRVKGYWPGKILQRTGRLVASMTASSSPTQAIAGTNVIYGRWHQLGAGVPARPFLGASPATLSRIIETIESYLAGD